MLNTTFYPSCRYLAAESIGALVVQFAAPNTPLSVMLTQATLIVMFTFAGGAFIRDDEVPGYWSWYV